MGTIAVDIYFAVLPWIFIFKLNLSRREKLTIAGSLSLGILYVGISPAISHCRRSNTHTEPLPQEASAS